MKIEPIRYHIRLAPDLERFDFEASAEITFLFHESSESVVLNLLDLAVWKCRVRRNGVETDCGFSVDPSTETLAISLPEPVSGELILTIDYHGHINDLMAGFYRSRYVADGNPEYIAVTQFQESDARRAFPCMDHPAAKAEFDIELDIAADLAAISNQAIREETALKDGRKRVIFETTPKMSTYLVFFGVGKFEIVTDAVDARVRTATPASMTPHAGYGREFGRKALVFSEGYYDVPYPLSKMDLIAIPDFAFGAMENWGAITFRENLLLFYPETTSKSGEQRICEVIAHEIAHQWFGNLVTPADWKYLWLNESFATFFGFHVVDHYHPEWEVWSQFLYGMTATAMSRDALNENFPIEIPGGEHVVINSSTAPIIYNKGGSILRQIEGYIGPDRFRDGLRRYLKTYAYGCAESRNLWEAFEEEAEAPVNEMMKSWVNQPGFPVIIARRDGDRLTLSQRRFTYLPEKDRRAQTWMIPVGIDFFGKNGSTGRVTTIMADGEISVDLPEGSAAYKINAGQTGFFRVKYEEEKNLAELQGRVMDQTLSAPDRWGVQNDLYHLAMAAEIPFEQYMEFVLAYRNETDYLPLTSIAENLSHAHRVLDAPFSQIIEDLAAPWYADILNRIGYTPSSEEPQTQAMLRDQLLWDAIRYGAEDAAAFATEQAERLFAGTRIHPDIARSVMMAAARMENDRAGKWLFDRFTESAIEHERMNILTAMGCFTRSEQIQKVLAFTLTTVPPRNKFIPVTALAANPAACDPLWKWYTQNLSAIEQFHPLLYERVASSVISAAGLVRPDEVKAFFSDYMKKDKAVEVIKLSLERLDINMAFRRANRAGNE